MDIIMLMFTYTVGTLFGLFVGAKWAYVKGIMCGITTTVSELESLNIINLEDWHERADILEKLKKISNNQENQ